MKSTVRLLLYAGLLAVLIVVVAYSLLLWQTDRWIERVRDSGADSFSLTHGLARFNLDGALEINDLQLINFRLQEPITAEKLTVRFASLVDALSFGLADLFNESSLPDSLNLSIYNVSIPLFADWQALGLGKLVPAASKSWTNLACDGAEPFAADVLQQIGFERLRIDGELQYAFEKDRQILEILGELRAVGFQTIALSTSATLSHDLSWPPPEDAGPPVLQHLQLMLTEGGFWQRYAQFCEGRSGLQSNAFWTVSLEQTQKRLTEAGIIIKPLVWAALPAYFEGRAALDIQLHPHNDFDYALMPFLDFDEQLNRLGLRLQLGPQRSVSDVVSINQERLDAFISPPPPPAPVVYRVAPPADLVLPLGQLSLAGPFIGRTVIVKRTVGAVLTGRLLETDNKRMTLATSPDGGELLYHLPIAELESVIVPRVSAADRVSFQKTIEEAALARAESEFPAEGSEQIQADVPVDTTSDTTSDTGAPPDGD